MICINNANINLIKQFNKYYNIYYKSMNIGCEIAVYTI